MQLARQAASGWSDLWWNSVRNRSAVRSRLSQAREPPPASPSPCTAAEHGFAAGVMPVLLSRSGGRAGRGGAVPYRAGHVSQCRLV
jgi:hypothetical protein